MSKSSILEYAAAGRADTAPVLLPVLQTTAALERSQLLAAGPSVARHVIWGSVDLDVDGTVFRCPTTEFELPMPADSLVGFAPTNVVLWYLPLSDGGSTSNDSFPRRPSSASSGALGRQGSAGSEGPACSSSSMAAFASPSRGEADAASGAAADAAIGEEEAEEAAAAASDGTDRRYTAVLRVRVSSLCCHPCVDERGIVDLDAVEAIESDTGRALPMNVALEAATTLQWLLAEARPRPNPVARMSDATLVEYWAYHAGGHCADCAIDEALPCSWETLQERIQQQENEERGAASRSSSSGSPGKRARKASPRKQPRRVLDELLAEFRANLLRGGNEREDARRSGDASRMAAVARAVRGYTPSAALAPLFVPRPWHSPEWQLETLLDPTFLAAFRGTDFNDADSVAAFVMVTYREDCEGVWSFPFFTPEFCVALTDELRRYEATDLPRFRPNSMNNYGAVLNELGLEPFLTALCRCFLYTLGHALLPASSGGNTLDHHHSFVVEYRPSQDTSLDMHIDDSEVTFNVNLCDAFKGSSLAFCGMAGARDHRAHKRSYAHALGRAVVHAGARRHGALPIESGERFNLIVWTRSSWHRGVAPGVHLHADETSPDRVCLSRTHDNDYATWAAQLQAPTSQQTEGVE